MLLNLYSNLILNIIFFNAGRTLRFQNNEKTILHP